MLLYGSVLKTQKLANSRTAEKGSGILAGRLAVPVLLSLLPFRLLVFAESVLQRLGRALQGRVFGGLGFGFWVCEIPHCFEFWATPSVLTLNLLPPNPLTP